MPRGDRVSYHSELNFTPGANTVVIIDESDDHVFANPTKFYKFSRKACCICLTATCADDNARGIER